LIELVHPVLKDRAIALPVDDNIDWAGRADEGIFFPGELITGGEF